MSIFSYKTNNALSVASLLSKKLYSTPLSKNPPHLCAKFWVIFKQFKILMKIL